MKSKQPERFLLRVISGGFEPSDGYTQQRLREKGYRKGDVVFAKLTKPRNPKFHRKMHVFGQMLVENIEEFESLSAHDVLKRLQLEANIACDEIALRFPGVGPCSYRIPRSLSFASMDDAEFGETFKQFSAYVIKQYWPDMEPADIDRMAEVMI